MKIINVLIGQRKSLLRDPITLLLTFVPFIIFSMIHFGLPVLSPLVVKWVNIYDYYDFIKLIVYMLSPALLGMVLGLLLMDEKDQDVLSYIAVTPLSLDGYIRIKTLAGALVGFIFNIILGILLKEIFSLKILFTFALSSLLVPYYALLIFSFSKNKVEALTKGKLFTFTLLAAVIPFFSSSRWVYLLVIFPTFWIEKVFTADSIVSLTPSFLAGMLISLLSLYCLKQKKIIPFPIL